MDHRPATSVALDLPPEASSTPRARRFVRGALSGCVSGDVVENAELCVSELVTNAVLHARTDIRVSVAPTADGIRLTVEDGSPARPMIAARTPSASTGRGLMLVMMLAEEWGIDPVGVSSKAVWCRIGLEPTPLDGASTSDDPLTQIPLDVWDVDPSPRVADPTTAPSHHMVLLGFPVRLGVRQDEHYAALVRECQLLREAALRRAAETGSEPARAVPHRLADLAETIGAAPKPDMSEALRLRSEAFARGDETIDLVYPVLPGASEQVEMIEQLLDEMDVYSDGNELLTLATPPEIRRLLSWILREYVDQEKGLPPRPWDGPIA